MRRQRGFECDAGAGRGDGIGADLVGVDGRGVFLLLALAVFAVLAFVAVRLRVLGLHLLNEGLGGIGAALQASDVQTNGIGNFDFHAINLDLHSATFAANCGRVLMFAVHVPHGCACARCRNDGDVVVIVGSALDCVVALAVPDTRREVETAEAVPTRKLADAVCKRDFGILAPDLERGENEVAIPAHGIARAANGKIASRVIRDELGRVQQGDGNLREAGQRIGVEYPLWRTKLAAHAAIVVAILEHTAARDRRKLAPVKRRWQLDRVASLLTHGTSLRRRLRRSGLQVNAIATCSVFSRRGS